MAKRESSGQGDHAHAIKSFAALAGYMQDQGIVLPEAAIDEHMETHGEKTEKETFAPDESGYFDVGTAYTVDGFNEHANFEGLDAEGNAVFRYTDELGESHEFRQAMSDFRNEDQAQEAAEIDEYPIINGMEWQVRRYNADGSAVVFAELADGIKETTVTAEELEAGLMARREHDAAEEAEEMRNRIVIAEAAGMKKDEVVHAEADQAAAEADDIIRQVEGMPGAESEGGDVIPPPAEISGNIEKSAVEEGLIAEEDRAGRAAQLEGVVQKISALDAEMEVLKGVGATAEDMKRLKNSRARLSGEAREVLREAAPELLKAIKKEDIDAIRDVETLLNKVRGKQKVGEKIRELKKKKQISEAQLTAYNAAKTAQDAFIGEATALGIPRDIARVMFRSPGGLIEDTKFFARPKASVSENEGAITPQDVAVEEGTAEKPILSAEDVAIIKKFNAALASSKDGESVIESGKMTAEELQQYRLAKDRMDTARSMIAEKNTSEKTEDITVFREEENAGQEVLSDEALMQRMHRQPGQTTNTFWGEYKSGGTVPGEHEQHTEEDGGPAGQEVLSDEALAERMHRQQEPAPNIFDGEYVTEVSTKEAVKEGEGAAVEKNEKKEIPTNVAEGFEKAGVGLDALHGLEGFDKLSPGRQLLMLQNYNSYILGMVRMEGKQEAEADWGKRSKLGKIGLSIMTLGTMKFYEEERKQKEVARKLLSGEKLGFENRQALLQAFVANANKSPEVRVGEDGKLQIEYASTEQFKDDPESLAAVEAYNDAAVRYAAIPRSWFDKDISFEKNEKEGGRFAALFGAKRGVLSGKEHVQLSDARERYQEARVSLMEAMLKDKPDTFENRTIAMKELAVLDERVRLDQHFSSAPEAEQVLQKVKDANVFTRALGEFMSKRGQYMAMGSITRIAAVATIGCLAAPVGLAMVGAMGYFQRRRESRDMTKLRRVSGALSEEDLREEVTYSVRHKDRLDELELELEDAEKAGNTQEIDRLNAEILTVKGKIKTGGNVERRVKQLKEFTDAKFFADRIERLNAKLESLREQPGQEPEAEQVERKIAQTATLMRHLMENNLLSFGQESRAERISARLSGEEYNPEKNIARAAINRSDFLEALVTADKAVTFDTKAAEEKIASIVGMRREELDKEQNKKAVREAQKAMGIRILFAGLGYAITHAGAQFIGGRSAAEHATARPASTSHPSEVKLPTAKTAQYHTEVKLPRLPKYVPGKHATPESYRLFLRQKMLEEQAATGVKKATHEAGVATMKFPEVKLPTAMAETGAVGAMKKALSASYEVHSGENLTNIMRGHFAELQGLPEHAQDNAMANLIFKLRPEQWKEIGITHPDRILPGQSINLEKLHEHFNAMRIDGETLAQRALRITGGGSGKAIGAIHAHVPTPDASETEVLHAVEQGAPSDSAAVIVHAPQEAASAPDVSHVETSGKSGDILPKAPARSGPIFPTKMGTLPEGMPSPAEIRANTKMVSAIESIFGKKFLFGRTHMSEWLGDPSKKIVGLRNASADAMIDTKKGLLSETVTRGSLRAYMRNLHVESGKDPFPGETSEAYIRRALMAKDEALQTTAAKAAGRVVEAETILPTKNSVVPMTSGPARVEGYVPHDNGEALRKIEAAWEASSPAERAASTDRLVSEYIMRQMEEKVAGGNVEKFLTEAKELNAEILNLRGPALEAQLDSPAQAKMVEALAKALEERGITPQAGFKYSGKLYDFVMQAYRVKLATGGPVAVK